MVVDAEGVIAHAGEIGGEALRQLGCGGRVGFPADVDAVETLRDAGKVFELEVVANGGDAAELAGRRMVRNDAGEIERRTGLDPRLRCDGSPVRPGLGLPRALRAKGDRAGGWRLEGRGERNRRAGAECGVTLEDETEGEQFAVPLAVVLEQYLRGFVEGDGKAFHTLTVEERE